MAQDAVKKVIEAERCAADKIAEARDAAKKLVADAEKSGREALRNAEAEAENAVKERLARAENEAAAISDETQKNQSEENEKLEALARGRMDKAAAVIAERVVNG